MSDDIVTRLRHRVSNELMQQAADEIERLREANKWLDAGRTEIVPILKERAERAEAERDALRALLTEARQHCPDDFNGDGAYLLNRIDAALQKKP
jgi:hypothetical protein